MCWLNTLQLEEVLVPIQPRFPDLPSGQDGADWTPKGRVVVAVSQVAQFMDHRILQHRPWGEDQVPVQVDYDAERQKGPRVDTRD